MSTTVQAYDLVSDALDCDLCIVGAGIAGLNALHSASCYLKPTDRVVLVEARAAVGGMWCDTYDYVRLHQPHQLFTAGNIPWAKKMPPAYLADRSEVQQQLSHCLVELSKRVQLVPLFGHRYGSHVEHCAPDAQGCVEIHCQRLQDGAPITIRARRLIKALSLDVSPSRPLALSSAQVQSVSVHEPAFNGVALAQSTAPIVIVGGGKTGMDTALHLIRRHPGRDIRMVIGKGVIFGNRDLLFAQGMQRWFGGNVSFETFLDVALRFDGSNTDEAMDYLLEKYGLGLNERPRQFQVGLLSTEELSTIRQGLSGYIEDYLTDVVGGPGGPEMRFRSGPSRPVPPGTWFVNTTGYLNKDESRPVEPYVSDSGRVLSISMTSLVFFLGSFSGYFLTHLFYRDLLHRVPLYQVPANLLGSRAKDHLGILAMTQTVLNVLMILRALPLSVMNDCLLDFNRWYPLPRRLPIQLRFLMYNRKYQDHCRAALDRLSERIGVPIGPLSNTAPVASAPAA